MHVCVRVYNTKWESSALKTFPWAGYVGETSWKAQLWDVPLRQLSML